MAEAAPGVGDKRMVASNTTRGFGHPIWELSKARFREFYRERGAVFWVFVFPMLMSVGLGIAFRDREPEPPVVAVVASGDAPAWLPGFEQSGSVKVQRLERAAAEDALAELDVDLIVVPNAAGGADYLYDPSRPESRIARMAADAAVQVAAGRTDPVAVTDGRLVRPGSRYVDFLMPGILGMNIMGGSMWGIGYTIIVARKRRLLRRLAATPMNRSHYLMGYMFSRLSFLVAEVVVLLLFAWLTFDVVIQGSLFALAVVTFIGASAFACLSLWVAARPDSLEAANGWMNFVMLPMWILSGIFFSYERFPEVTHPFIQALPLTALNDALRAVINRGAGVVECWPQIAVLGAWGIVAFFVARHTFRWS